MADIRYVITADSKGAVKSVQKLDKQIDKMPQTAKKAESGMKNLWLQVGAGIAAAQGVIRGLKGLIRFMGDTIDKAKEQEKAEIAMEAALKTTGREITKNSEHYRRYASSIQKVTMFGDEEILKSQALLLQLTDLRKDGIDKATEAAVGLATVYDQDLSAATVLVGKALAGNFGALSRYGIQVDKNLSASEKQVSLLEQLGVMYGRAKEETLSFAGIQKQLTNLWGDMQEQLGEAVTESKELRMQMFLFKETMQAIVDSGVISDFAKSLENISNYVPILKMLKGSMALISTEIIEMAIAEKNLREATDNAMQSVEGLAGWAKTLGLNIDGIVPFFEDLEGAEDGAAGKGDKLAGTISKINTEIKKLPTPMEIMEEAFEDTNDVIEEAELQFEDFGETGGDVIQGLLTDVETVKPAMQEHMAQLISSWTYQWKLFSQQAKQVWFEIAQWANYAIGSVNASFNQMHTNEMIRIDNEQKKRQSAIDTWYEQQKQAIMNNITDETEREAALEKLEEERRAKEAALQEQMEAKRKAAKRAQAKRDKAVALMQAIVNTASAVVEALPNLILAGIVGAMGAAQIALIASQPIPLAKGGIIDRPTFLAGEAGKEAVIPLESSRGKDIIRETFRETNRPIYITVQNKIDENWFRKKVTKIIEQESKLGRLKINPKAVH